jgi:preprotein translocase subunit SecG
MELALQITLVVTSVLVVLLVLLHRAKGGGLSTLFGGGVQSSLSGSTVVEKNLDRLTLFVVGRRVHLKHPDRNTGSFLRRLLNGTSSRQQAGRIRCGRYCFCR